MNIVLHILNASGNLSSSANDIQLIFNNSIRKIVEKLPISNVDVIIADNSRGAIPEVGIGGRSLNPNLIFISINHSFPNLKKSIIEHLDRIIAHELHHCMRRIRPGYGKTLLEAMVSEGLADHFDYEINHKNPQPWTVALNKEQIKNMLEKAKVEFYSKRYDHQAWFFGRGNINIPRWAGYSLGFFIVGEYLKKYKSKKPSQIYNMKAEEFIK